MKKIHNKPKKKWRCSIGLHHFKYKKTISAEDHEGNEHTFIEYKCRYCDEELVREYRGADEI